MEEAGRAKKEGACRASISRKVLDPFIRRHDAAGSALLQFYLASGSGRESRPDPDLRGCANIPGVAT